MRGITRFYAATCISVCTALLGCLDPYNPPTTNENVNFLVIDGSINSTDGTATVKLSRALRLNDTASFPPEVGATVTVEAESGDIIELQSSTPGVYAVESSFDHNTQYRLRIITQSSEYLSEFIKLELNTNIDSLSMSAFDDRAEIYVSSHDPSEGHKYYRYAFDETYEYRADLFSRFKLRPDGTAELRVPSEFIYSCWTSIPSQSIVLANTENLSVNRVSQFPIQKIMKGDKRLWVQYSILAKQLAISKEAYQYWEAVKKVSESNGGLFDPIPYAVKGNITSTNSPDENVLGYFSGGDVTELRLTFRNSDLPNGFNNTTKTSCVEEYVPIGDVSSLLEKDVYITRAQYMLTSIIGFWYSIPECTDCKLQGGTDVKPDFMN
jgi:Domain of unknown function (DUF4249)